MLDLPIELAVPFRIGPDGAPVTVSDPNVILRQHVMSVVGTQKGERVMLPDYGVNSQRFLFSAADENTSSVLQGDINDAIHNWEPDAKSIGATIVTDQQENTTHLIVQYQDVSNNNPSQTVTINVNAMGQ